MRNTTGFTLIELLTVVMIIGLLAAIALPKFVNTRERTYYASIQSDLRNLATAEEDYFAKHLTYTKNLNDLTFNASRRVIVDIQEATDKGWRAKGTYSIALHLECEIYYGTASGATLAAKEGSVHCNN